MLNTNKFHSSLLILLICFIFHSDNSSAAVYYISNSGNDANNGLSPVYPIQSINKLNSFINKLQPGDAVLFERGGYFQGQINLGVGGNENNPIVFGAYGTGKNPAISGSVPVKNWSLYKGNIFKAETDYDIKNLFFNGKQMTLARYPNSGFLTVKEPFSDATKGFKDDKLTQSPSYWKGSNVRIRTINWAYEYTPVKSFSNGSVFFQNPVYYPAQSGWGYYLDNNLNELDTLNEWYFEKNKKNGGTVYMIFPSGGNPGNYVIEGSAFSYGFFSASNIGNVIVRDIELRNQVEHGISFSGKKTGIKFNNCTFSGQMKIGICLLNNSENCEITNCRFTDINGKAIYLLEAEQSVVSENVFANIGMIPGYGVTKSAFGMSAIIALNCNSILISRNSFYNTGHDAINCIGYKNTIEKNVISNSLLMVNDGAAIKSYGKNNTNSVWRNNFIFNVKGNLDGTPRGTHTVAMGAYLDEYCSNMNVINNTITGCGNSAINFYNETNNNFIKSNVCYGNQFGIFFYKDKNPMVNNYTSGNIFFGKDLNQFSVKILAGSQGYAPGKFDSNYYCNPFRDDVFLYQTGNLKTSYNYNGWKKLFGNIAESGSKVVTGNQIKYSKLFTNMSDDTSTVLLDQVYSYYDLNMKSIYGSVTIMPWSSEIILSNADIEKLPEIYTAVNYLNFGNVNDGNASVPKWYKLFGNNLKGEVTISAPEGFEISFSGDEGFSKSINVFPESGKTEKIIFVRFVPDKEKSYYDSVLNTAGNLKAEVRLRGSSR